MTEPDHGTPDPFCYTARLPAEKIPALIDTVGPAVSEIASVVGITDVDTSLSDELFARMRLTFANGWGISVIRGFFSYGTEEGLFEIAPIAPDGGLVSAEIEGWLTVDDVVDHCRKIAERDPT